MKTQGCILKIYVTNIKARPYHWPDEDFKVITETLFLCCLLHPFLHSQETHTFSLSPSSTPSPLTFKHVQDSLIPTSLSSYWILSPFIHRQNFQRAIIFANSISSPPIYSSTHLQSGFCPYHSTTASLAKVTKDIYVEKSNGFIEVFIFLDLSATFDTPVNWLVSPFFQVLELVLGSLSHYNLYKSGHICSHSLSHQLWDSDSQNLPQISPLSF